MSEGLYIGLLSGTSRDGVDAALIEVADGGIIKLHFAVREPYAPDIADELASLVALNQPLSHDDCSDLHDRLGGVFAGAATQLLEKAGVRPDAIRAIGSHGQTVWHAPRTIPPVSIQLGNADVIARETGILTVAEFRTTDIEAGGEGAPLAPLLHQQLFSTPDEYRAILNLGGIANVTLLEPGKPVRGFDSGPGNCLMDAWIQRHLGEAYDAEGKWAASGWTYLELAQALKKDPYFSRPPPKSTGVEYFNLDWLADRLPQNPAEPADIQATLAELTAITVADAVKVGDKHPVRLLVCGGGVHNPELLMHLQVNLLDTAIQSTERHGVDPDWLEGMLFAWLASEHLAGRKQDTRSITGASRPVLLGTLHTP